MTVKLPERIESFEGPFRFLSNFYLWPVNYLGVVYPTAEHAYQAAKAESVEDAIWVRSAKTPAEAKYRGRTVKLRSNWDAIKNDVMADILRAKFSDPSNRRALLQTGNSHLEEGNWWGDRYWGTVNGKGENWLGKLLMQVRGELQEDSRDG